MTSSLSADASLSWSTTDDGRTSTERQGLRVTPRLPNLEFGNEVRPRWVNDDAALTSLYAALGVFGPNAETWIIRAGKSLLQEIRDPAIADETRRFIQQEAYHARVHERMNRLLEERGHPVAPTRRYVAELLETAESCGGPSIVIGGAMAAEQVISEMG